MKLIFNREALISAITPMLGSVSGKNTIASISGILFSTEGEDKCVLSAYDLEKGMRTELPCQVDEGGSYVLPATKLSQIIRTMPMDTLSIRVDESTLRTTITSGQAFFEITALRGEDFPSLPYLQGDHGFLISRKELSTMLGRTLFAVGQNDARTCLNGAFFRILGNTITTVGCNGNCLSLSEKTCELQITTNTASLDMSFIIPGKTLAEMLKLLSDSEDTVELQLTRKHVMLKTASFILFSRLIEQEYVDYNRFLPKSSRTFANVDTDDLISSLERALLVTEDKLAGQMKSPVKLIFDQTSLTVRSESIVSKVEDLIPIRLEGEGLEIGFNCRLLLDALRVAGVDKVRLSLSGPLMSMIIEPVEEQEDGRFLLLVLPVRLGGK